MGYTGWLLVRENPDSRHGSDPISALPIGFGHDELSDLSGSGRVRSQAILNVIGFGPVMSFAHACIA